MIFWHDPGKIIIDRLIAAVYNCFFTDNSDKATMTDRNFRLNQSSKRILATILDSHERGVIKRALIQAQVIAARSQGRSRREAAND